MEDKTTPGLQEQRLRRRRINRMKTSILTVMGIWMLISFILIITLLVKLLMLEGKLDQLAESMISVEQISANEGKKNAASPEDSSNAQSSVRQDIGADEVRGAAIADSIENISHDNGVSGNQMGLEKKVYLTFDDGPSENTARILDILKEKNIKATFFVTGQEDEVSKALYQRIVAEGHTLGMHSYTHKYSVIYESLDAFDEDMTHLQNYLTEVTGVTPKIMRFPGGSSNQVSNTDMSVFISYLKQKGITYYDWNVVSGDATSQVYTADELVQNVMGDVVNYDTSIVLMHDASTKATTVDALIPIIDQLQAMGAEILPIDQNTKLIQHIPADSIN